MYERYSSIIDRFARVRKHFHTKNITYPLFHLTNKKLLRVQVSIMSLTQTLKCDNSSITCGTGSKSNYLSI